MRKVEKQANCTQRTTGFPYECKEYLLLCGTDDVSGGKVSYCAVLHSSIKFQILQQIPQEYFLVVESPVSMSNWEDHSIKYEEEHSLKFLGK